MIGVSNLKKKVISLFKKNWKYCLLVILVLSIILVIKNINKRHYDIEDYNSNIQLKNDGSIGVSTRVQYNIHGKYDLLHKHYQKMWIQLIMWKCMKLKITSKSY